MSRHGGILKNLDLPVDLIPHLVPLAFKTQFPIHLGQWTFWPSYNVRLFCHVLACFGYSPSFQVNWLQILPPVSTEDHLQSRIISIDLVAASARSKATSCMLLWQRSWPRHFEAVSAPRLKLTTTNHLGMFPTSRDYSSIIVCGLCFLELVANKNNYGIMVVENSESLIDCFQSVLRKHLIFRMAMDLNVYS